VTTIPKNAAAWLPLPPLIYISAIALGVILHYLYPLPWLGSPLSDILFAAGWLAIFGFVALFFTAVRTMTRAKTTLNPNGVPDHLVTGGPFGVSRNPIYLADTLLMIGVGLIFGMLWMIILSVVAGFLTQKVAIEREEKVLTEKFGKKYRDYAKRVRRWI
jgi:protein-S-isoprenylcysteine O-methyltransferase Ste14